MFPKASLIRLKKKAVKDLDEVIFTESGTRVPRVTMVSTNAAGWELDPPNINRQCQLQILHPDALNQS